MGKPSIEEIKLPNASAHVTRLSYLKIGKDDFEDLCQSLQKVSKKRFKQLLKRLQHLAMQKFENVKNRKTWEGLSPVWQFWYDDHLRVYAFHYHVRDRRLIFLNWTAKKSQDTDPKVVTKARKWHTIALEILEGK